MRIGTMILLVILVVLIFWIAPSIVIFFGVFYRRKNREFDTLDMSRSYYAPLMDRMNRDRAALNALPRQEAELTAPDGTPLWGLYYPNPKGNGRTVVFMHGFNSTALNNFAAQGRFFYDEGFDLLMPNERAHGRSGGRFTTFGVREQYDLLAWIDWLRAHTATEEVLLYGTSMGGAAIALLSDRLDPALVKGMVLDCAYTSPLQEFVQMSRTVHFPWRIIHPFFGLCVRYLLRCDLDVSTLEPLRKTQIPALFFQGLDDTIVPAEESRLAYEACAAPKEKCFVPGAGHTAAFLTGGETTENALRGFIKNYFKEKRK